MGRSVFEYIGNLDTLIAVMVGAVLATGGALTAEIIQDRISRRRQERDAARFFGEILTSIDKILDVAFASQSIGDRWGRVTERLFKTAISEAAVYERNRERLFDIRDMGLRQSIHRHFLQKSVSLVAVLEYWDDTKNVEAALKNPSELSPEHQKNLNVELSTLHEARESALQGVIDEHAKTDTITSKLEKIARVEFDIEEDEVTDPDRAPA